MATEVRLGRQIADHVLTDASHVRVDELKTGTVGTRHARTDLLPQVRGLLVEGFHAHGSRFAGVRVISIADRSATLLGSLEAADAWVAEAGPQSGRHAVPLAGRIEATAVPLSPEQASALSQLR